jgi:hypothetical protein
VAADVVLLLLLLSLLPLLLLIEGDESSCSFAFPGCPGMRQLICGQEWELVFPIQRIPTDINNFIIPIFYAYMSIHALDLFLIV